MTDPAPLLDLPTFAAKVNLPPGTVRAMAGRGAIPGCYRVGSRWRFDWEEFKAGARVRPALGRGRTRRTVPAEFIAEFFAARANGRGA